MAIAQLARRLRPVGIGHRVAEASEDLTGDPSHHRLVLYQQNRRRLSRSPRGRKGRPFGRGLRRHGREIDLERRSDSRFAIEDPDIALALLTIPYTVGSP